MDEAGLRRVELEFEFGSAASGWIGDRFPFGMHVQNGLVVVVEDLSGKLTPLWLPQGQHQIICARKARPCSSPERAARRRKTPAISAGAVQSNSGRRPCQALGAGEA